MIDKARERTKNAGLDNLIEYREGNALDRGWTDRGTASADAWAVVPIQASRGVACGPHSQAGTGAGRVSGPARARTCSPPTWAIPTR